MRKDVEEEKEGGLKERGVRGIVGGVGGKDREAENEGAGRKGKLIGEKARGAREGEMRKGERSRERGSGREGIHQPPHLTAS